ncbi:hypothetical protein [Streptomyces coffeae]|uniref:Uncharacterized protein n=1 Tax=Streptomyces coffeae TaxID=621382 RepID=A0ABS1NMI9_9ACTN|nr:hypothetical protein [Streptomyces coffeae]MBL1101080.1 hypothetical protein [Streptomyces coffeae]
MAGAVFFRGGLNSDHVPSGFTQPLWWLRELGGMVVLCVGVCIFLVGRLVVVRGKQHTAGVIDCVHGLAGTRYVLYLRPFSNDPDMASLPDDLTGGGANTENLFFVSGLTHEEALVRRFRPFGRVVAIGRPGEPLPLPGAARAYLPLDDWQDAVSGLIEGAHVVLLSAGPGPGTVWEFVEALRVLPPERLVLLAYCDPAAYNRFREAVAEEYSRRSRTDPAGPATDVWPPLPALPDFPPPSRSQRPRWEVLLNGGRKRLRWDFPLKGLVAFGPDWQATFIRFDPTTLRVPSPVTLHRLVKRELQPVLDKLTALSEPH